MRSRASEHEHIPPQKTPWALEMKAVSIAEPGRLVKLVTGAILGCGGWVLSRGANDAGVVSLLFEFERSQCIDMYSALVSSGVELSPNGHLGFTELCRCTRLQAAECGGEIASVDLEIQTLPAEDWKGTACTREG